MLEAFLPGTFGLLQAQENGLRNNPDTVDDFFRLNARFLQRAPLPYLQSDHIRYVFVYSNSKRDTDYVLF